MSSTVPEEEPSCHRAFGETRKRMVKADLSKREMNWGARIGAAITRMRLLAGLSLKELSCVLDRDEKQIGRWTRGQERPQFDVIFSVPALRAPLIVALSELTQDGIDVQTVITVRRA